MNDNYDDGVCDDDVQYGYVAPHRSDGSLFEASLMVCRPCTRHVSYGPDESSQSCSLLKNQSFDLVVAVWNGDTPHLPIDSLSLAFLIYQHVVYEAVIWHLEPPWLAEQHYDCQSL